MRILLTGGSGYIGSHIAVELLEDGHEVVIIDNLSNSKYKTIKSIEELTQKKVRFYEIDLRNIEDLRKVFQENDFDAVIHLAGLKSVNQSIKEALSYYDNNIVGTLNLLKVMEEEEVKNLIFSSSAAVYGDTEHVPISEDTPRNSALNPYGKTKVILEDILEDIYKAEPDWNIVILRYFNPMGAHSSGLIGEDPIDEPQNLIPQILQVISGELPYLSVYGDSYETPDGTGIRDFIHIEDLARGHVKALENLRKETGLNVYNLGSGKGYSVLEIIRAFEEICKQEIPYKILPPRPGDIAVSYCDTSRALEELGWSATKNLEMMCRDALHWKKVNES